MRLFSAFVLLLRMSKQVFAFACPCPAGGHAFIRPRGVSNTECTVLPFQPYLSALPRPPARGTARPPRHRHNTTNAPPRHVCPAGRGQAIEDEKTGLHGLTLSNRRAFRSCWLDTEHTNILRFCSCSLPPNTTKHSTTENKQYEGSCPKGVSHSALVCRKATWR